MKKMLKLIKKGLKWYCTKTYEFYKPMYQANVNPFMV